MFKIKAVVFDTAFVLYSSIPFLDFQVDSRWISSTDVKFDPHTLVKLSSTGIIVAVSWQQCYDRLRTVESCVRYSRNCGTDFVEMYRIRLYIVPEENGEESLEKEHHRLSLKPRTAARIKPPVNPPALRQVSVGGVQGSEKKKRNLCNLLKSTNYNYCSIRGDVIINFKVFFLFVPCLLFLRKPLTTAGNWLTEEESR